jgi:hypothetical protein
MKDPIQEPAPQNPWEGRRIESPLLQKMLSSEVMIVALAAFVGYTVVFAYQFGYCFYYGIPYNLITLNLSIGLGAAAVLLGSFYSIIFTQPFWGIWLVRSDEGFRLWAGRFTAWTILGAVMMWIGLNCIVIIALLALLTAAARPLGNFMAQRKWVPTEPTPADASAVVRLRLLPQAHFFVALAALIIVIAFAYGRYTASQWPEYIGDKGGQSYIVLQIYGDYLVASPCAVHLAKPLSKKSVGDVTLAHTLRIFKVGDPDGLDDLNPRGNLQLITPLQQRNRGGGGWILAYQNWF